MTLKKKIKIEQEQERLELWVRHGEACAMMYVSAIMTKRLAACGSILVEVLALQRYDVAEGFNRVVSTGQKEVSADSNEYRFLDVRLLSAEGGPVKFVVSGMSVKMNNVKQQNGVLRETEEGWYEVVES